MESPCLRSLKDRKNLKDWSFIKTKYQLLFINLTKISMILLENPKLFITLTKNFHDPLSYALVMSSLTTTLCNLFLLLMSLIIPYVSSTFLVIFLYFTKSIWLVDINSLQENGKIVADIYFINNWLWLICDKKVGILEPRIINSLWRTLF